MHFFGCSRRLHVDYGLDLFEVGFYSSAGATVDHVPKVLFQGDSECALGLVKLHLEFLEDGERLG